MDAIYFDLFATCWFIEANLNKKVARVVNLYVKFYLKIHNN